MEYRAAQLGGMRSSVVGYVNVDFYMLTHPFAVSVLPATNATSMVLDIARPSLNHGS